MFISDQIYLLCKDLFVWDRKIMLTVTHECKIYQPMDHTWITGLQHINNTWITYGSHMDKTRITLVGVIRVLSHNGSMSSCSGKLVHGVLEFFRPLVVNLQ